MTRLGRGDLNRAALGFWAGPVCSMEIRIRLEEKKKVKTRRGRPSRGRGGGGRVVDELELRVRRGSWKLFSRGRAAGLGEKSSWESLMSKLWVSTRSRAGSLRGVRSSRGSRRKIELRVFGREVELRVSGVRSSRVFFLFLWTSSEKSRSFRAERIHKIEPSAVREDGPS
ncbi:hypothetical protein CDL15_Pgr019661 [Punica granatum]|uniref:Uncharacterized protein n=1 Tax=Punica granatum TaxID=22663 RepID=A0A218X785_PUNGR|nr:hypothetical protein CDL15_Pgr019661 [Punica granatum]PKI52900.1 hypothetical protein CRG98_026731 [Punica granatum]